MGGLSFFHSLFQGPIPDQFGALVNLSVLSMSYNSLSGSLQPLQQCTNRSDPLTCRTSDPSNEAGISRLSSLRLAGNLFSGSLSDVFSDSFFINVENVREFAFPLFEVWIIHFFRSFRSHFNSQLDLSDNNFTGVLPRLLPLAGALGLRIFDVRGNPLLTDKVLPCCCHFFFKSIVCCFLFFFSLVRFI